MCRPNETHQDHLNNILYTYTHHYILSTACVRRHTTGEPGDLLLYSCSRFRVPFIAYTHAHKYISEERYKCVFVYMNFFFSIPFFPFLRPSDRIRLARARALRTRSVSVHSATGTTAPPTHRDIRKLLKTRRLNNYKTVLRVPFA